MKVKTYISTSFTGQNSLQKNDCAIRAAVNATGIDYQTCDIVLQKYGKKANKGSASATVVQAYRDLGLNLVSVHGSTSASCAYRRNSRLLNSDFLCTTGIEKGISYAKLIESDKLKNGNYVVVVTGHAIAVINGIPVDTFRTSGAKSVVAIFKFGTN